MVLDTDGVCVCVFMSGKEKEHPAKSLNEKITM